MHKFWLVAQYEYLKIVAKRSFLIGTLGIPVLIVVITLISTMIVVGMRNHLPLGYVDESGLLADAAPDAAQSITLRAFPDVATARAALQAKEVQAFYHLPADYLDSGRVELYYLKSRPGEGVREAFADYLQSVLIARQPEAIRVRLLEGARIILQTPAGDRTTDMQNPLGFIVPLALAFFFTYAVMIASGYMLDAITDEKVNRTLEVLSTTLRPVELIGGKAVGLMGVGLTQLAIWTACAAVALAVGLSFAPATWSLHLPWPQIGISLLFFLPAYALGAGLMTAIGSGASELRQAQQIAGIVNLLFMLPYFFITAILFKPNGPLSVALTLFPTSAFMTLALRWAIGVVPVWQVVCSWLLLTAAAAASVWLASRIYRMGMLNYGQPFNLKHILAALYDRPAQR